MKKISIITINYNNIQGLVKTVEGVMNQTFKDYEYIIIDGGSNDGALDYLKSIDTKIDYWVSEPDKGIFSAMNKGIEKATGEYLLFLNSGDCLNGKGVLNNFINHQDFKGDIIYGDLKFAKSGMKFSNHLTPFFFIMSSLPHQATLFKKEVFDQMGLYDETLKISSDRGFYIKCFLSNQFQFQHIPLELTFFDQSGISRNPEQRALKTEEDHKIFKKYYGIYYEDYIKMEEQRVQISHYELNTIIGIMKRVVNKINKIVKSTSI